MHDVIERRPPKYLRCFLFSMCLLLFTTFPYGLAKTNEDIIEFIEKYIQQQFPDVSEELLQQIVHKRRTISSRYNPYTDTPWFEHAPLRHKYQFALHHIWNHHILTGSQQEVTNELVRLLFLYCNDSESYAHIANSFPRAGIWGHDIEENFKNHLESKERPLAVRATALGILLEYADLDTYIPYIPELIDEQPKVHQKFQWFTGFTNHGNKLFALIPENRALLLQCGFNLLMTYSQSDRNRGYFVARRLGFILKISDYFSPDQSDPQYKAPHGLKNAFFQDTVTNAINWYVENEVNSDSQITNNCK